MLMTMMATTIMIAVVARAMVDAFPARSDDFFFEASWPFYKKDTFVTDDYNLEARTMEVLNMSAVAAHESRAQSALTTLLSAGCVRCAFSRLEIVTDRVATTLNKGQPRIAVLGGSISAGGGATQRIFGYVHLLEYLQWRPADEQFGVESRATDLGPKRQHKATIPRDSDACLMESSCWSDWNMYQQFERISPLWHNQCGSLRHAFNYAEGGTTSSFSAACLEDIVSSRCNAASCVHANGPVDVELGAYDAWILEFYVNDCALGHEPAEFERLVRRLLGLPGAPAVIVLLLELQPGINKHGKMHESSRTARCPQPVFDVRCGSSANAFAGIEPVDDPGAVYTSMRAIADLYDLPVIDARASFAPSLQCAPAESRETLKAALPLLIANRRGERNGHPNDLGHAWIAVLLHAFLEDERNKGSISRFGGIADNLGHTTGLLARRGLYLDDDDDDDSINSTKTRENVAQQTSCLFASDAATKFSKRESLLALSSDNGHNRDNATASVKFDKVRLDLAGSWNFHDLMPSVTRVDVKIVLRLRPGATLDIEMENDDDDHSHQITAVSLYRFVASDANQTLCCTSTDVARTVYATRCITNSDAKGGRYVAQTVARLDDDRWSSDLDGDTSDNDASRITLLRLASVSCRIADPMRSNSTFDIRAIIMHERMLPLQA